MQKVLAKQQERSKRSDSNHQVVNQVAENCLNSQKSKKVTISKNQITPLSWWRVIKLCINLANRNRFSVVLVSASDIADNTSLSDNRQSPDGIRKSFFMLFLRICWWDACSVSWQLKIIWSASSVPTHPGCRHLFDLVILRDLRNRFKLPTSSTTLFHVVTISLWFGSAMPWNMCREEVGIPSLLMLLIFI